MGPARLEVFKFSFYVFFPIAIMLRYGDPDWYDNYVLPYKPAFVRADKEQIAPPSTPSELQTEIERLRDERLRKRALKLSGSSSEGAEAPASSAATAAAAAAQSRAPAMPDHRIV